MLLVALLGAWAGWTLGAHISGPLLARVQASPQYAKGRFVNAEKEAVFEFTWAKVRDQLWGVEQREPPGPIPVLPIAPESLQRKPPPGLRAIWLGHAGVLLEIDGQRILTDPILSERASPLQLFGPGRFHPSPIALKDLVGIDAVVISHNHYDHLDEATIRHLAAQGTPFFVPLGTGNHLAGWGVSEAQIHDMDWWQETKLGDLKIVATPSRHYSGRGLFDVQATLWASWTLIGPAHRVFYSGDSGYAKAFAEIGARHAPFDLAIVKIGAYGPGEHWHDIHMTPEEAVQVSLDVGGKRMLPVHWGTFNLALHAWDEPIIRARKAAAEKGVELLTPKVGEIVAHGQPYASVRWWTGVGPSDPSPR